MELKKLVYLYLMNYAKSNPDLAIMAVNTFVKARSCCYPCVSRYTPSICHDDALLQCNRTPRTAVP